MKLLELVSVEKDTMPVHEMANFDANDTGFKGMVYISSEFAEHGPRVKWFPERPSRKGPCLIVTVAETSGKIQKVENHHLPEYMAKEATKSVEAWIEKNREKILKFWNEAFEMTRTELKEFTDSFERID